MIEISQGNLLEAPVEALVNTVNTVGVMGKGIALQFKQAYPAMYRDYERACKNGDVRLGRMHVYDLGGLAGGPRWLINFPTKGQWRSRSRIADIEQGLKDLVEKARALEIKSIALPPLGCGHGGLSWNDVRPMIEAAFAGMKDVRVLVFAPKGAPEARQMPSRTERPKMTLGQAALVGLMDRYLKGLLDPFVTLLEIHKLMYFLKEAGENLPRLKFQQDRYGPYSPDIRHGLVRMEKHLTSGFGEGSDDPRTRIELLPGAIEAAYEYLKSYPATRERMERVATLIEGFEDPLGMELLSSVHWVMGDEPSGRKDPEAAISAVHRWNERKRRLMKPEHLRKAWSRLKEQGWDQCPGLPADTRS